MIRKIVEKLYFRYLKVDTEAQSFDAIEREEIFATLRGNEEYTELLRAIMKGDIQRYFNANDDTTRDRIRGEYQRTSFFLKMARGGKKPTSKTEKSDTQPAGRYA